MSQLSIVTRKIHSHQNVYDHKAYRLSWIIFFKWTQILKIKSYTKVRNLTDRLFASRGY